MDFNEDPQHAKFREEARGWLAANAPGPVTGRRSGGLSDAHSEAEAEHVQRCKDWQATKYDAGWAGITWPEDYGGRGGTAYEAAIFAEEEARIGAPSGIFAVGIGMAGPTIIAHGTDAQKRRFLGPMLRGDEVWCQLFSEPGAGSDLAGLATRAVRDGDEWIVNGQKVWTSGAHYSDYGILLARTNPDAPKHRGITYFLVDMRTPGVEVRPLRQITGAAHFNEVFLTDVRIPAENVVGDVNDGWRVAMTTLTSERALIGGGGGGGSRDVFAELLATARRFGRDRDPVARQGLSRAYIHLQLVSYLGMRARTAVSQGRAPGPEVSVIKLAHSQNSAMYANLALGLEGSWGMLADSRDDVAAWHENFLGHWAGRIGGGTDQVQRNVIGERVLGLPGDIRVDKDVPFKEIARSAGSRG